MTEKRAAMGARFPAAKEFHDPCMTLGWLVAGLATIYSGRWTIAIPIEDYCDNFLVGATQ